MIKNIFLEHLKYNRDDLIRTGENAHIAEHGGNIGSIREGLITKFLEQNLPEFVRYHSGQIFDSYGKRSGQIDIVLHPITSPKLHLLGSINLFPTETVLSAIEVKSNLDRKILKEVMLSCKKVKELQRFEQSICYTQQGLVDVSKVPYILFCYKGCTLNSLVKNIQDLIDTQEIAYKDLPDLILVLDRGYCLEKPISVADELPIEEYYTRFEDKEKVLLFIFTYLMKLIEDWASNSSRYAMPIKKYEKVWKQEIVYLDFN